MTKLISILLLLSASAIHAASAPVDFAGNWSFDPALSKNTGMMNQGKIQTVITQSPSQIEISDNWEFNGQADTQRTIYDLTGKPVSNTSMMAGQSTTRSHWLGSRLVTDWESAGAIAGTTVKRTETRYLSADGQTMFVESQRSGRELVVMVFSRTR